MFVRRRAVWLQHQKHQEKNKVRSYSQQSAVSVEYSALFPVPSNQLTQSTANTPNVSTAHINQVPRRCASAKVLRSAETEKSRLPMPVLDALNHRAVWKYSDELKRIQDRQRVRLKRERAKTRQSYIKMQKRWYLSLEQRNMPASVNIFASRKAKRSRKAAIIDLKRQTMLAAQQKCNESYQRGDTELYEWACQRYQEAIGIRQKNTSVHALAGAKYSMMRG